MVQNYTIIMNNATFWLYFFYITKKKLVEDTEFPCGKLSLKLCSLKTIAEVELYNIVCGRSKHAFFISFLNGFERVFAELT